MKVTVKLSNAYGRVRYYPLCKVTIMAAEMCGKKTFDEDDLTLFRNGGYDVEITKDSE